MTGHAGKDLWYVRMGGRIRGPYTTGQIGREILLGRIRDDDELAIDQEHWRPLRALPQLVPQVMRHAETEEGRQHLLLARLRVDERLHDRRAPGHTPTDTSQRHGDRRTVESFDVAVPHERETRELTEAGREERNLLLPAAVLIVTLFMLATYFLWYRPANPLAVHGCQAAPAASVNWSGCEMPARNLNRADLSRADLSNSLLKQADLQGAQLRSADLSYANLEAADLRAADLRAANLKGASLRGANLSRSDLRDADLGYADLQSANLQDVRLDGARLGRAIWTDGRTCADGSVGGCR